MGLGHEWGGNFAPSHGSGVTVYDDHLEGYAWAENLGWIRLGTHTGGGTHTYANNNQDDYGVNRAPDTGALSGYAWSPTVGWIKFDPANGGVTVDGSGSFAGYAWGENIGWIHFQHSDPPVYGVLARLPDAPIPTLSEWGMLTFVGLLGGYEVRRLRRKSAN